MNEYLTPTEFLDFDEPSVREFAERAAADAITPTEKVVKLYYAVRDGFSYNPYKLDLRREGLRASNLLARDHGYCVEKAVLLAASARAASIPSRLSFYNVRNHIATERLVKILKTDVLIFHGAAELFLNGKWLKTTPAFNAALCRKLNVAPLEFDGAEDSLFQQYDEAGNCFMDYLHDYGNFADMPYELYLSELRRNYPHISSEENPSGDGPVLDLTNAGR